MKENVISKFSIKELESYISENYKDFQDAHEEDFAADVRYEMYLDSLHTTKEFLHNEYRKHYPYAFRDDLVNEALYSELENIIRKKKFLAPKDILNATKIQEDDGVYICKFRFMKNGHFMNRNIAIHLNKEYPNDDKYHYEIALICSTLCRVLGHILVKVLTCVRVNA